MKKQKDIQPVRKIDGEDWPRTWVWGKAQPGWYCAMDGWRKWYEEHLRSLGYEVRKSTKAPTEKIAA